MEKCSENKEGVTSRHSDGKQAPWSILNKCAEVFDPVGGLQFHAVDELWYCGRVSLTVQECRGQMKGQNQSCAIMQGEPFTSQGVDEHWFDKRHSGDVSGVERRDPRLPEVLKDLTGRFCRFEKIWAGGAAWIQVEPIALDSFYGPDAGQDHLLQSPLPSRWELVSGLLPLYVLLGGHQRIRGRGRSGRYGVRRARVRRRDVVEGGRSSRFSEMES